MSSLTGDVRRATMDMDIDFFLRANTVVMRLGELAAIRSEEYAAAHLEEIASRTRYMF